MSSAPTPQEIARDAHWLVQALDPAAGQARLIAMDANSYRAASFLDVPPGNLFYSAVWLLVHNDITAGVGSGNYGVNDSTLRQQMAVFLLKGKHGICYAPPPCTHVFPDVPCPSNFADWIEALAADGTVEVTALVERLGVSAATVRRDLQLLEEQRMLSRTHGGAVAHAVL